MWTPGFRIDAYFLHKRGLFTVLSPVARSSVEMAIARAGQHPMASLYVDAAFADATVGALQQSECEPLRKLLMRGTAQNGLLTWEEAAFYFRTSEAYRRFDEGDKSARVAFHTKLSEFGVSIQGTFSPEHIIDAASARGHLSGRTTLLMFGFIESLSEGKVDLRPLLIGRPVLTGDFPLPLGPSLFVAPQLIREFSALESIDPRSVDIQVLKDIPERTIKQWFAEIIGEHSIPKDWGGEQSDLWTTRLSIGDEPVRAAFLFKGPAAFHPLAITDLGKNGDQIDRLFKEPADILILQHCHFVRAQVNNMMGKYASDFHAIRRFSIIDGPTTCQILKAHGRI